jgi:Na+/H+ antiporter NhaC
MKEKTIELYFSQWLALVPLLFFIFGAMYLGLSGTPDEKGFWPIVTASLIIALFLSKKKDVFAYTVISGMAEELLMIMVTAWLFSSIIGVFLRETGLVEAIVFLYISTELGGGFFVVGVFVISALVGTSTGTAVGTVLIVTPVLFKAGLSLGCDQYFLLGAILGGAAFGDDFSPLSDTTIAAASTQCVNIGKSVRSRVKYAFAAGVPAMLVFGLFGGGDRLNQAIDYSTGSYRSLAMLVSPLIVIALCLKGRHILTALLLGIFSAVALSVGFDLIPFEKIFSLDPENFTARSLIIDGMDKGVGISVFSILLIGLVSFVLSTNIIEILLEVLVTRVKRQSVTELVVVFLTVGVNTLLAHNTITIMSIGRIVRDLSDRFGINRIRSANIMDISGNTVMHILPYMITVVLATSIARRELDAGIVINPFIAGLHNFHSIFLFGLAMLVSGTGLWRENDKRYL